MYVDVYIVYVWQTDVFLKTYQHEGLQINTKKKRTHEVI